MKKNIEELRARMKDRDISVTIIPLSDPHMSEYIGDQWKFLPWLSQFTGSAGTLIVSTSHAGLWTDSRYFIQAEEELQGTGVQLHRYIKKSDHYAHWIQKNIESGAVIGFDGRLFSIESIDSLRKLLSDQRYNYKSDFSAIDLCWTEDRPKPRSKKVFLYDDRYAGTPRSQKLKQLRKSISKNKVDWILISALDEIAWLLNLRGRDIDYNPVFYAYLLVGLDDAYLYIDEAKLPEAVQRVLESENVFIEEYNRIWQLSDVSYGKVMIDKSTTSVAVKELLRTDSWTYQDSPVRSEKAKKSIVELQHIGDAMIQDGVALTEAFYWLDQNVYKGITEYDFAQKIADCRKRQLGYYGESFPAIVGSDGNGAIVHYRPHQDTSSQISMDSIVLCDSGGQYLNGTTDITRTICLSQPSNKFKEHYTRVLKGHIAINRLQFPVGTTGGQIDILARQALWQVGLNYGHGTGHGVGYFLNVHEGPQSISPKSTVPLEVGMIISNEPGYYLKDTYGIRIENLISVVPSDYDGFLCFDTLTVFPIKTDCVDWSILTTDERAWLTAYNDKAIQTLIPHLSEELADWLRSQFALERS